MKSHPPKPSRNPARLRATGQKPASAVAPSTLLPRIFAAAFGLFLGLCLLKFGNPPIMERFVEAPGTFLEALPTTPWPIHWAYWLLALITILGLLAARPSTLPLVIRQSSFTTRLLLFLPLAWLLWQCFATHSTFSHDLSLATIAHFTACVVCFYLGLFAVSQVSDLWPFWLGLFCGFIFVMAIGFDQHFGGLEESRNYVYHQRELYPGKEFPPEFLKKIASNRIYSTLFYPNSLAGALLLFLPCLTLVTLRMSDRWHLGVGSRREIIALLVVITIACLLLYLLNSRVGWLLIVLIGLTLVFPVPRWVAPGLLCLGSAAILFWSGSKAGWLLMLLLCLIVLLRAPVKKQLKTVVVCALLLAGLAGFFVKYAGFFQKGATSVGARFDYWHAAIQTTRSHPVTGTGPGTFAIPYEKIKRPESEMARMVHNDYLEQASDSGLPGFLAYTAFIVSALILSFRSLKSNQTWDPPSLDHGSLSPLLAQSSLEPFAVWLGLLGWAAQCTVEFSLYIPALAWPAFTLLGWLLARPEIHSTNSTPPATVRPAA